MTDVRSRPILEPKPPQLLRRRTPGPAAHRAAAVIPSRSARVVLLVAALVVAITGAALGALFVAASGPSAMSRFPLTPGAGRWVAVPGAGPTSWYGTILEAPKEVSTATLWVQADQVFQVWVNGRRGPSNATEVRAAAPAGMHGLDLLPSLRIGRNGVVVRVINADDGAPALFARLQVRFSDGTSVVSATGDRSWLATSQAAQVGTGPPSVPRIGEDIAPGEAQLLPTGPGRDWVLPAVLPRSTIGRSPIPAWVLDERMDARVIGGSPARHLNDATVTTTLRLPAAPDSGWLRVAASGSFAVVVNGTSLGETPLDPVGSLTHLRTRLYLFDIARLAGRGPVRISVHVHGASTALVAADAGFGTPAGRVRTGTGSPGWRLVDERPAGGQVRRVEIPATPYATVQQTWPSGLVRSLAPAAGRSGPSALPAEIIGAGGLLVLWLLLAQVLAHRQVTTGLTAGARLLAVAATPALSLIALTGLSATWSSRSGAFPLVPAVWWLALALLVLGWAAVPLAAGRPIPWKFPRKALPAGFGVGAIALAATGVQVIGIEHEPLWQDEATSLIAATSIRDHFAPVLPSGLTYFKGELYHGLLAVLSALTGDVGLLRMVSLLWFLGTVLAFGLLLLPVLLGKAAGLSGTGRQATILVGTLVFAVAPAEVLWAREIRMYQQMQFFVVVFLALFLRALRDGRRRDVMISAGALIAMYLSHEESFVLLPAVPVMFALTPSARSWRQWFWWVSFGTAGLVVCLQYGLSQIHPPKFGEDLSNRSYVGWDPHQATFYYDRVFSAPLGSGSLVLVSTLALIAAGVALHRRDRVRALAATALLVSVASMSLVFTAKVERYSFAVMPLLFALAACGTADVLGGLARLAGSSARDRLVPGVAVVLTGTLTVCAVTVSMARSPRDFSLAAARVAGTTTIYKHLDYQNAAAYIAAHDRPGDRFTTLSPPNIPAYYLRREPDAIIQTGRNKLLYVIERDGRAVDTIFGAPDLLAGKDLDLYLAQHHRVWLVSDLGGYLQSVPPDLREELLRHFRLVYSGAGSTVWLWSV